jgi:hypothetical protein
LRVQNAFGFAGGSARVENLRGVIFLRRIVPGGYDR